MFKWIHWCQALHRHLFGVPMSTVNSSRGCSVTRPQWLWHHDDVIKWKHFPRYWLFVRGIHRSPLNSPHKSQWRGALMFFFNLRPNKRFNKQSSGWWFEKPSRSLWRHCNDHRWYLIVPWENRLLSFISHFQTYIKNRYFEHFLWKCPLLNATRLHWWLVNLDSCNGLVPPDTSY